MQVIYAKQPFPTQFSKAIFLAGPTPRKAEVKSWRPEALEILKELKYDGIVFVPEEDDGKWHGSYEDQIDWEEEALHLSDCILFWVPRDMSTMPALTTNIEYGRWYESGKIVFGAPESAPSVKYLEHYARKFHVPVSHTLKETLESAITAVGDGSQRTGGECHVPLYIWKTATFQDWYTNLKTAGNRLDGARVEWTFRVGKDQTIVFFWALHVDIYIASEKRNKTNEVVIVRPDIATIIAYHPGKTGNTFLDTEILFIKEFRSPVSNTQGFVHEMPGGSSFKPGGSDDMKQLAADECFEETSLKIDAERIKQHESRQMVATLSAHQAHLFSVELTEDEINQMRSMKGTTQGVTEDTERTYVEVKKLSEILKPKSGVDWSTLGMILSVIKD